MYVSFIHGVWRKFWLNNRVSVGLNFVLFCLNVVEDGGFLYNVVRELLPIEDLGIMKVLCTPFPFRSISLNRLARQRISLISRFVISVCHESRCSLTTKIKSVIPISHLRM